MIRAEKPVRSAAFYALFRNTHAGKVWFDDLFFGELGSDVNLLKNPGFEPLPVNPFVLDGAYIDSLEGWSTVLNYERRHFADVTVPLVFDTHTRKPVILTIFSTYEFAHELHKRMRARGKLMMANGVLHRFPWFAHLHDVMGTETNWHRNKTWRPMSDAALCFVRALCYQKPYCFLMNTHYDDLTFELTERYMKRSLFYGCFPGMFSEDASTNPYFGNPKWYNRDRELFRKYVPLTQRIAKAGWEPLTHATTDHPKVYVERWGDPKRGEVFLTVLNDSDSEAAFALTVDVKALGLASAKELTDLISGKKLAAESAGDTLRIRGALAREDVWLLSVR
ncbi:MAG: hypothetical protein FJ278_08875 [Planctomycetes bacterium]|nr:hypothetical protein [Planctomycetota bacterium]